MFKVVGSATGRFFLLTHDVQDIGVPEAPVLILHNAGVVAFVGRHHRLHDQGPHVVSDLKCTTVEIEATGLDV